MDKLPKITIEKKKRLGRGYGSGKGGHTVGRGSKGQKSRSKVPIIFEGTKIKKSLLKRIPLQRGKGKLKPTGKGPLVINIKYLNVFKKDELVDLKSLVKKGMVDKNLAKELGIKILGDGELEVALKIALPCSKAALKKIEKAGGEMVK